MRRLYDPLQRAGPPARRGEDATGRSDL